MGQVMNQLQKSFSQFLIIWIGQLLSRIGSGISIFALGIHLLEETRSTSAYSLLLFCAFIPSVLLAPFGGVIADRKERKLMMVLGDLGSAICVLFIIVMLLVSPDKQWPIYLGIAMSSLWVTLHSPAFKASVTDMLDEKMYSKASGLIQLAEASRYFVSPVIAGFLLAWFNLPLVLVIDVITFVAGALMVIFSRNITRMHCHQSEGEDYLKDFIDGIKYITRSKIIRHLLCLTTLVTFFTGILQALFVPIVLSFTDTATLGTVQSIAASGMLLSSLLIGLFGKTENQYTFLLWSLGVAGLFYLLIGTTTNTLLFTVIAFCFFLTLPLVNTSLEVLFRQNIINEMQGRIWSLISFLSQIGMLVALSITGALADNLFNPLLTDTGRLAETVGSIIGTGQERGSGLMVIISGSVLMLYSIYLAKRRTFLKAKRNL